MSAIATQTLRPKTGAASVHAPAADGLKVKNQAAQGTAISQLIGHLSSTMLGAVTEIEQLNFRTRLVSLNARIEAARAGGTVGAAFGVVAQEVQGLSAATADITKRLAEQSQAAINQIIEELETNVRGTRLSDLALTNVDLIDRNLYERTCDVRWWATDASIVAALQQPSNETIRHVCQRMGVILDAYTVYFDLVLCDLNGKVIANGRPNQNSSIGSSHSDSDWFPTALATRSGEEFGFQSAHASPLVNQKRVLVYSCTVREDGNAHGKMIGVLGVLFNWDGLSQTILTNIPVSDEEKPRTRGFITDDRGVVLADSECKLHGRQLELRDQGRIYSEKKYFSTSEFEGRKVCVAHAIAPGFETYTTGWRSVIVQANAGDAATK